MTHNKPSPQQPQLDLRTPVRLSPIQHLKLSDQLTKLGLSQDLATRLLACSDPKHVVREVKYAKTLIAQQRYAANAKLGTKIDKLRAQVKRAEQCLNNELNKISDIEDTVQERLAHYTATPSSDALARIQVVIHLSKPPTPNE